MKCSYDRYLSKIWMESELEMNSTGFVSQYGVQSHRIYDSITDELAESRNGPKYWRVQEISAYYSLLFTKYFTIIFCGI
jgi:hypothetical protein